MYLKNIESSFLRHVDYFKTVDYSAKLLGKEDVLVLLLEELIHSLEEFAKKLSAFLGINLHETLRLLKGKRANIGLGHVQLEIEALRTKWYPLSNISLFSKMLNIYLALKKSVKKNKGSEIYITKDWSERLKKSYTKGNRELATQYDLPLEKYGYPI